MIKLEYFTPADFKQLIEWIDSDFLMTNWAGSLFRFPLTHESLEWYIRDTNIIGYSDAFVYKAVDTDSGKTVGHISLGGISEKNMAARISRVLVGNVAERGKGVCTGMIKAVLKIGFEDLGLHRISLGVYDFNTAAIRCYKKCGFVQEGVMREALRYEGNTYWSLVEMGILENEWRELQKENLRNREAEVNRSILSAEC
jgi:RimJ/RimL family protein N-acetyltransferase